MDGDTGEGYEVGDVFVAVVEIVGEHTGGWEENQRPGGDGFRGVPNVGVEEGVIGTTELLDAEVVVVDETLEGLFPALYCTHLHAAAHAVEGHRDHGVAGFPSDGSVFGIVDDRPNTSLGLDTRLVAVIMINCRQNHCDNMTLGVIGGEDRFPRKGSSEQSPPPPQENSFPYTKGHREKRKPKGRMPE